MPEIIIIIDLGDDLYSYALPDWSFLRQWTNDPEAVAPASADVQIGGGIKVRFPSQSPPSSLASLSAEEGDLRNESVTSPKNVCISGLFPLPPPPPPLPTAHSE